MNFDHTRLDWNSRAIESIHSGLLLFVFTVLLSLFMGAVMLINGS